MFLNSIPFLRLAISLAAGIAFGLFMPDTGSFPAWLMSVLVLLPGALSAVLIRLRRWQPAAVASLLLANLMLGFALSRLTLLENRRDYFRHQRSEGGQFLKIRIEEPPGRKTNTWRATGTVMAVTDSAGNSRSASGRLLVYWPESSNPQKPEISYGDELLVPDIAIEMPGAAFPEGFDFKAVMRYRNIGHQIFLTAGSYRKTGNSGSWLRGMAFGARKYITDRLNTIFSADKAALMASLLLGYKDEVNPEDLKAFAITGTMHVLAVSGMHVGLIYMALLFLFTGSVRSGRLRYWQGFIILLLLWAYAFITGLSASVMRATVMFTVVEIGRSFLKKESSMFNSLFAAAYIQLLFAPLNLIDVGFQLSYLAVLGILYFYPPLNRMYSPPTKLLSALWQLALVSVAATLGTLPVSLFFFKSFPLWFIPANMLIVPASSVIIFLGIASLLLSAVPLAGVFLAWITSAGIDLMMWPARFLASLPGASISGFTFDLGDVLILGLLLIAVGAVMNTGLTRKRSLAVSVFTLLFSGKQCLDFYSSVNSSELIVCEIRGQMLGVLRQGRDMYVISEPVSRGRADSLLFYTRDYCFRHSVSKVRWHIAGKHIPADGKTGWKYENGISSLVRNGKTLACVAWLPDSSVVLRYPGPVFSRYRYKRYLADVPGVQLLKNDFIRVDIP